MAALGEATPGLPRFVERWPWIGGDLQTLRNSLLRPRIDLPSAATLRHEIDLGDGTGDRLLALVDQPRAPARDAAAVVLVHGLTGCSESSYMRASAAALLGRGHVVMRLNLRGAGPGRPMARGHYNAGSSADLAAALQRLPDALRDRRIVVVGYSLGANILLKHLGEAGREAHSAAAVGVSVPIDLAAASRRLMAPRNAVYHRYLLRRMKVDRLASAEPPSPALRALLRNIADIRDFDDRVVAPAAGHRDADAYYARSAARGFLAGIHTPTLLVQAVDDPWIPIHAFRTMDWSKLRAIIPVLAAGGGHVGFHGRGDATPWHDRAIAWFLRRQGLAG
ncbi:MAG: alpha/beta fold hydrolase [Alphaproteobacteria bacterium]|nr:alpha/beta fold hydrolase [Alphaproteobacteria bacterium]